MGVDAVIAHLAVWIIEKICKFLLWDILCICKMSHVFYRECRMGCGEQDMVFIAKRGIVKQLEER